jgi:glycine dehydrogenase subunit 2
METPNKIGVKPEIGSGTQGLIFKEPLLWEKSKPGRCGISIPLADVETSPLDPDFVGGSPALPELNELDVVRHYTRLSQ